MSGRRSLPAYDPPPAESAVSGSQCDLHRGEQVEKSVIGFPSIDFWRGGAEPYRFVVWKRVKLCTDPASGYDDASLAVTRCEDA